MLKAYANWFILAGIILFLAGILLKYTNILNYLGKLPGDIFVKKENFTFIFPITTMIIISVLLNIIIKLIRK